MSKLETLEKILEDKDRIILAFSGGPDSTFLAYFLKEKGKQFYAVTVDSGVLPDLDRIKKGAEDLNIKHEVRELNLLKDKKFVENSPERCYFCKKQIISALKGFLREKRYDYIMDATNYSDLFDNRIGIIALKEENILSPLLEAEITEEDIVDYSKEFKPPESCLATRIPYYTRIKEETIVKIRAVEDEIKRLGVSLVRARVHGNYIRLQVLENDMGEILKYKDKIHNIATRQGFEYVTLDLKRYPLKLR
jgi:uncharacterized protein